ncbi:MAG: lysophospholipase L1-like esterase [Candidatus Omnitrophota bacterium]|jgi:lysophospholipase L1-like esterase
MKKILLTLSLLCIAAAQAEDPKKPFTHLDVQDGQTFLFLGDSITHQCLYTQYVEDFFYTRFPDRRINFVNAGISGDWAIDALERWEGDVAVHKPDIATVLLGMNDGSYQGYRQPLFEQYERDMSEIMDRFTKLGTTTILTGPSMYDTRQSRKKPPSWVLGHPERTVEDVTNYYAPLLAYFGAWARDQALYRGMGYVDMLTIMNNVSREQRAKDPDFTMVPDAVHPDPNGQAVMAFAILDQMHVDKSVSAVNASRAKGNWRVTAGEDEVTDVSGDEKSVHFTFKASALPWVLPEEAQAGYGYVNAGHKLSNERIRVQGLAPGKYDLKIDDTTVGTYTHSQLGAKVELQANVATPQYQQALKVAQLNKERNVIVKKIRGQWGKLRSKYHRPWREGEKPEGYEAFKAKMDKEVADLFEQVAAATEKIYAAAQPVPRRYVLTPAQ